MKQLILSLCLIFACSFTGISAESVKSQDQLRLKSGEVINGNIISRNDNEVTILNSSDGIQYFYSAGDIAYITHAKPEKKYNTRKFRGMIDFGYGIGIGSPRDNIFMIETSFGYQFNKYLYLGGGIALNFHKAILDSYPLRQDLGTDSKVRNDPNWNFPFVPLYVNLRSQLYDSNRFTPFVDLKIGASVINYMGFYFSPSIGIHIPTTSFLSLNVMIGYTLQQGEYKLWTRGETPGAIPDDGGSAYLKKNKMLSAVNFRIGVEF
ncbi:MAG: hypothetical protein RR383_00480 [Muribaculaceae bacterium]